MKKFEIGVIRRQPSGFGAFIPHPFPPESGFDFPMELISKNAEAARLVGKLDGITALLPNVDFFLLMYLRKDAASSSQIEGTLATMVDAIQAEVAPGGRLPHDVDDILHYIKALRHGLRRVQEDRFPLSLRFIRELHQVLASGARASHFSNPGEFRATQNWIGGTRPDNARFVPPPAAELPRVLGDLEKFIHAEDGIPVLIKAGLIHAQFETIHPFLDGNGRAGRMLITFYLWQKKFLEKPVLYLSAWFKRHQHLYYDLLEGYHKGQVVEWLDFFLDGVIDIAGEAILTVEKITALRDRDYLGVQSLGKRSAESACLVLPRLFAQPIVDAKTISEWTGFTRQGTQKLIDRFIKLGILTPRDEAVKYSQLYVYQDYLDIFIQ